MMLDVMQAAAEAEPVDWWVSAQSPWWAAPVSTLAGAVLAWLLARLTEKRKSSEAAARETRDLRRQAYADLWSVALEEAYATQLGDTAAQRAAMQRAGEVMLTIELVAPEAVQSASREVMLRLTAHSPSNDDRVEAMIAFKDAVRKDLGVKI